MQPEPQSPAKPGRAGELESDVEGPGDRGLGADRGPATADRGPATADDPPRATSGGPDRSSPSTTFTPAIGASMLGLEQALRSQPPAQVLAWEHRPVRGSIAAGGGIALEFPDDDPDPGVDVAESRPSP